MCKCPSPPPLLLLGEAPRG
jgi:hypothetical protein